MNFREKEKIQQINCKCCNKNVNMLNNESWNPVWSSPAVNSLHHHLCLVNRTETRSSFGSWSDPLLLALSVWSMMNCGWRQAQSTVNWFQQKARLNTSGGFFVPSTKIHKQSLSLFQYMHCIFLYSYFLFLLFKNSHIFTVLKTL